LMFVVNLDKWNSLPPFYKEALTSACLEVNNWVATKYDASNAAALKRLAGQGVVLQPFSPEVMDGCHKAAGELYAELNQKNPAFKKLYDSYKAFMDDGYLWHQVADYTMAGSRPGSSLRTHCTLQCRKQLLLPPGQAIEPMLHQTATLSDVRFSS
jgi:TRAP-type mannitol/chloroaromatic compound transport system substrate-binding protein